MLGTFFSFPGRSLTSSRIPAALADQVAWGLASFLSILLIGRYLGPADLGAYSVGQALIYGVGVVWNSFLVTPSAVIGIQRFGNDIRQYAGGLLILGTAVVPLVAAAAVYVWLTLSGSVSVAVSTSLLVAPLVLSAWLLRQLAYVSDRAWVAASGSLLFSSINVVSLFLLGRFGVLGVRSAAAVVGIAAVPQIALVMVSLRPRLPRSRACAFWRAVVAGHWEHGKWLLGAGASGWVMNRGFIFLVAGLTTLQDAGAMRACDGLGIAVPQLMIGLNMLLLPRLVRGEMSLGSSATVDHVLRVGSVFCLLNLGALMMSIVAATPILSFLYGDQLSEYSWLLVAVMGLGLVSSWVLPLGNSLQVLGSLKGILIGQGVAAAVALSSGSVLGAVFGLPGLVAGLWLANLTKLGMFALLFRASLRAAREREARLGCSQHRTVSNTGHR